MASWVPEDSCRCATCAGKVRRALVIEDHAHIRENVIELLESEGFVAFGAEDGRRGLAIAYAEQPDLVLCDLRMPGLSGLEVLREIRASRELRDTPFILLTGAVERADIERGLACGADEIVAKPFSRGDLLAAVRAAPHRHFFRRRSCPVEA